jgi:D-alanyl-D-alanine carboxypeptidase
MRSPIRVKGFVFAFAPLLVAFAVAWSLLGAPTAAAKTQSYLVIDAATGQVLSARDADVPGHPASLTKMMTLYLLFEAMERGKVSLDQRFVVSEWAAEQSPTRLGLTAGGTIAVRDLILGIITQSANDAAVVVAENLGGSESAFAEMMTQKARQLGMSRTLYHNASGLPDPGQITTARDLARLALALYRDFPNQYGYFATESFTYNGITHANHNRLMRSFQGMDGIKTGYVRASGFNLAASAVRNNRRLIGIVMGGSSPYARDMEMAQLLSAAFAGETGPLVAEAPIALPAPLKVAAAPIALPEPSTLSATPSAPAVPTMMAAAPPTTTAMVAAPMATTALAAGPTITPSGIETQELDEPLPSPAASHVASHDTVRVVRGTGTEVVHVHLAHARDLAGHWGIQVGAFSQQGLAIKALAHALVALSHPHGKAVQVLGPTRGEHFYRARIINFSERDAEKACSLLHREHAECAVVNPRAQQLAQNESQRG